MADFMTGRSMFNSSGIKTLKRLFTRVSYPRDVSSGWEVNYWGNSSSTLVLKYILQSALGNEILTIILRSALLLQAPNL